MFYWRVFTSRNVEGSPSQESVGKMLLVFDGHRWIVFAVALLFLQTVALANDIKNFEFGLRLPAALSSFASYADVAAMGGAQAASEWSSSINPASAAWPHKDQKYRNAISPQFTGVRFTEGTSLYIAAEAVTAEIGQFGVLLPAAAQVWSNHEEASNGLGFQFDAQYYQMQWGKLIAPDWAIGANFNVSSSDTRLDIERMEVARTRNESYNFRFGALRQATDKVRLGIVFEYSFSPSRTDLPIITPLGLGTLRIENTGNSFLLRPGISWEYLPDCHLYGDYQAGVFYDDDTQPLWVHRFPIGIEHSLVKNILYARAGTVIDTRGTVAVTGGVGLYLSRRASLDLGYQHNVFTEIRKEFGSSQTFVVSVGLGF